MANTPRDMLYLKIAQFNIQSLNSKKTLLIDFLNSKNIDICLLNEIWTKPSSIIKIPQYNFIHKSAKNEHGGVGILIKNTIKYKTINTTFYENLQNLAISVTTSSGKLNILCIYCPPGNTKFKINNLSKIVKALPKPLLISGDMNAHHLAFGCSTTSIRGQDIYNMLDELDFCILNTGSPTTVSYPHRSPSAIDISSISSIIAPLCEWFVHDDPMGSDHFPTIINMNIKPSLYEIGDNNKKYLYNKADWFAFKNESENAFNNLDINVNNVLNSYDMYYNILNDLKDKYVPLYNPKKCFTQRKPAVWWNDKCREAVIKTKNALKNYKLNPTTQNFIIYKKNDALKKKIIKEEKLNSWKELCTSFNRITPVGKIWNFIKKFKNSYNYSAIKNDEWIPNFVNKCAPNLHIDRKKYTSDFNFDFNFNDNPQFLSPFSFNEFITALKFRRNTSPGLDDITYQLIKNLHTTAQIKLLQIFNILWQNQLVPSSWKVQCVIPILKPHKDPNNFDSYRPISLTSCIGKLFEAMIKFRLEWFIETNNIISNNQFAYRKGKSASESFCSLISDIKNGLSNNSNTLCVFLDIQGAFDSVDIKILIQILKELGFPGKFIQWVFNFLFDRTLYVKFNNILHGPKSVYKGVMQGSVLSPIIYNLYTSQILQYINTSDVKILQFADDIVIYNQNINIFKSVEYLNLALKDFYNYYHNKLALHINPNKSSLMIFSKFLPPGNSILIKYNNIDIPIVNEHKFLGVILDPKLSFAKHIDYISKNALRAVNILKCLARCSWGADPTTLTMLYKSIVRSHFDYSTIAYFNCNPKLLKKLDVIQNRCLRIILGAMCSTPIRSMEVESLIEPLVIRRNYLANRFCLKAIVNPNKLVYKCINPNDYSEQNMLTICNKNFFDNNLCPELLITLLKLKQDFKSLRSFSFWPCFDDSYYSKFLDIEVYVPQQILNNADFNFEINQRYKARNIYTDGSKCSTTVRSAFYDSQLKTVKSYQLNNNASIFTAEAFAILKALEHVNSLKLYSNLRILTDSLSVLNCLKNPKLDYKLNYLVYKIREAVNIFYCEANSFHKCQCQSKSGQDDQSQYCTQEQSTKEYVKVEFMWIPSHKGIKGNEIADKAAVGGLNETIVTNFEVPFTDYYSIITAQKKKIWQEFWLRNTQSTGSGKWYLNIQNKLPTKTWFSSGKYINREFITILCRMRMGHFRTPAHLCRLNIVKNSNCTHCDSSNCNLEHIIFFCPAFSFQRLILAANLSENQSPTEVPRQLQILLQNPKYYLDLYSYIKNTVESI